MHNFKYLFVASCFLLNVVNYDNLWP